MPDSKSGTHGVEPARDPRHPGSEAPQLDQVCEAATRLLKSAAAVVSLAEPHVARVAGGAGLSATAVGQDVPLADSLCARVAAARAPWIVRDATADTEVAQIPAVRTGIVGSYLGVPIIAGDVVHGALCAFDPLPREWTEHDLDCLQELARWAAAELALAEAATSGEGDRLAWRLAVDAAGVGAFEWDLVSGALKWDNRLKDIFGTTDSQFGGTIEAFNNLVHPDDAARVTEALQTAIETCGSYVAEYRVTQPGGLIRWVSARGRALADRPGGPATQLLGAAYDTTFVREGEARVGRVLESMPAAFFQLDAEWRFTYANAEAERLLSSNRSELIGETVWEKFPAAIGSDFEVLYRHAVDTGQPVRFDAYYPPPLDAWYEVRAWPAPDGLSVYFLDVSARRQAQDKLDEVARRARILAAVTDAVTGTLDAGLGVSRLADLVVPLLADWCVVTLVHDPGGSDWRRGLQDVGWNHKSPDAQGAVRRYADARLAAMSDQSFVAQVIAMRQPVVLDEQATERISDVLSPGQAKDTLFELRPDSAMIVPLLGRGRTTGILSVYREDGRESFSEDDKTLIMDIAARAGLALDNARLYAEQRDLAEALQRSFMTEPPQPDHLQIAVRYQPAAQAAQVGGDWYDAFLQPHIDPIRAGVATPPRNGTDHDAPAQDEARSARLDAAVHAGAVDTVIVIGDVVGHDVEAAAAMGQVRSLLRGIAVHTSASPADVMRGLDNAMAALQLDTTATAVVARIDHDPFDQPGADGTPPSHVTIRWSNAGHPPPVLLHANGTVTLLDTGEDNDLLLGFDPRTARREHAISLNQGDTLLLYTDGLVERRGQTIDEGLARLTDLLTTLPKTNHDLEGVCEALLARLVPAQPDDDVALLAVRLRD